MTVDFNNYCSATQLSAQINLTIYVNHKKRTHQEKRSKTLEIEMKVNKNTPKPGYIFKNTINAALASAIALLIPLNGYAAEAQPVAMPACNEYQLTSKEPYIRCVLQAGSDTVNVLKFLAYLQSFKTQPGIDVKTPLTLELWGGDGGKSVYPGSKRSRGGYARVDTTLADLMKAPVVPKSYFFYGLGDRGLDSSGGGVSPRSGGAGGGAGTIFSMAAPNSSNDWKKEIWAVAGGGGGASIQWPVGGDGGVAYTPIGAKKNYAPGQDGTGTGYGGGGSQSGPMQGNGRFSPGGTGYYGPGGATYEDATYEKWVKRPGAKFYNPVTFPDGGGSGGIQQKKDATDMSQGYAGGGSGGGGYGGGSSGGSQKSVEGGGGGGGSYARMSTVKLSRSPVPSQNPNPDGKGAIIMTFYP
jgi:hypothetical protein